MPYQWAEECLRLSTEKASKRLLWLRGVLVLNLIYRFPVSLSGQRTAFCFVTRFDVHRILNRNFSHYFPPFTNVTNRTEIRFICTLAAVVQCDLTCRRLRSNIGSPSQGRGYCLPVRQVILHGSVRRRGASASTWATQSPRSSTWMSKASCATPPAGRLQSDTATSASRRHSFQTFR